MVDDNVALAGGGACCFVGWGVDSLVYGDGCGVRLGVVFS
jgi:hypothetical protein